MAAARSRLARRSAAAALAAAALYGPPDALARGSQTVAAVATNTSGTPQLRHVFVLILENQAEDNTFGSLMPVPYLQRTVAAQGAFVPNYYGTSHYSLGNYVSLVSGQSATTENQADCPAYDRIAGAVATGPYAQIKGDGCIYPPSVLTLPDQLTSAGFTYRGYMEDMGNDPAREGATCGQTQPTATDQTYGHPDLTRRASSGDQYAQRHNPFVYFDSLVGDGRTGSCSRDVVPLSDATLTNDLQSVATTPNFSFITPNLCDDGHDVPCTFPGSAGTTTATYANEDAFLRKWVPIITRSPAFRQDGLLMVTFDESSPAKNAAVGADTTFDGTSCCGEESMVDPNTATPGIPPGTTGVTGGSGGGKTGTILLSPFIAPGTVTATAYDHYNALRSFEDEFGFAHLGFAGFPGTVPFGTDVFGTTAVRHAIAL